MLAQFNSEHWHDEDEVRFIVEGRGLFHIHPAQGPVFAIEVEAGDLIRVPRGTHHWFDSVRDRRIRAIRLFQDPSGWTPHYTSSGVDRGFQPVCFGPRYFPPTVGTNARDDVTEDSPARSRRSCSTSKAPRRRSRLSTTCCFRSRGFTSASSCRIRRTPTRCASLSSVCTRSGLPIRITVRDGRKDRPLHESGVGHALQGMPGRTDDQLDWAASYVEWLMDRDRKSPALKLLQGRIWEGGYRAGVLRGEVFADVPPALERWHDAGLDVAIYSSGSELAQRLIFGSTVQGDLTRLIVRFFDTAVGAKGAPESYRRIAAELGTRARSTPVHLGCDHRARCGRLGGMPGDPVRAAGQSSAAGSRVFADHQL